MRRVLLSNAKNMKYGSSIIRLNRFASPRGDRNLCSIAIWRGRVLHPWLVVPLRSRNGLVQLQSRPLHSTRRRCQLQGESFSASHNDLDILLPTTCPGCGAFSQQSHPNRAGFYTTTRRVVKAYIAHEQHQRPESEGSKPLDSNLVKRKISLDSPEPGSDQAFQEYRPAFRGQIKEDSNGATVTSQKFAPPLCDRCHNLIYQSEGVPIAHPVIQSIADTITSSTFRRNHVYHVIDAVDFPLSVIPGLFSVLSLVRQRSQNRRAKDPRFKSDNHDATVSFIITRSDLLAPQKEQVDRMMPWFIEHLRTALGRHGEGARMGNVHLVSSKRGWWTVQLKDELRKRGGANWMVGKVNVGKSNLLEVLLPKGMSGQRADSIIEHEGGILDERGTDAFTQSLSSIPLPPPQPLSPTPTIPLISSLPGTTASPIRLPFVTYAPSVSGRGELIDLPGLERSLLSSHVKPAFQKHLVMASRPRPEKLTIKPGQSLLVGGGLVRITSQGIYNSGQAPDDTSLGSREAGDPLASVVIMAYPFVPAGLGTHVTSTEKAIQCQLKERDIPGAENVLEDSAAEIRSAGVFELSCDVTRKRAEKVLRSGVKLDQLFFKAFSTEILIEGVGWIELVASVRQTRGLAEWPVPEVEVFTPNGKYVASRQPLGIWSMLESDLPKSIKDRRKHAKAVQTARIRQKR